MIEKNAATGDTQNEDIPADWDSFTSEIQAVAAKKQQRLSRDKLLFYVWSFVLISAIAALFWLLVAQRREQYDLVERETKRLEERIQEQVAEAKEQIEDTRRTASEKVHELAQDSILKDDAVRRRFAEIETALLRKVENTGNELRVMNEELGRNLNASLTEAKGTIERDKLEFDGKIKQIKDLSESLSGKLADKADQSKLDSALQPIQTELRQATTGVRNNKKLLDENVEFFRERLKERDQVLASYAKTTYVINQLRELREALEAEMRKKADKPQQ